MKYFLLLTLFLASAAQVSAQPPRTVRVVGTDYAFAVPTTVKAGLTSFQFRNNGTHAHEFNVFLLKPGVTIDQIVAAAKAGKPQLPMIEGAVGVLFADAGSTAPASLDTNLLPGRDYGILCILRDSANAPQHFALGMYAVMHVAGQRSTSRLVADTIVAVDYAYGSYPRQISPGLRGIAFRNAGKHRHEFNMALLKKGITLDSIVERDKRGVDVEDLFEVNGGIGVLHAQPGNAALGTLGIDFLPGREYLIDCSFSDDEKSPPHYKLGMYGSIKVRSK